MFNSKSIQSISRIIWETILMKTLRLDFAELQLPIFKTRFLVHGINIVRLNKSFCHVNLSRCEMNDSR